MSTLGNIASWVTAKLISDVSYLNARNVFAIAEPEEFREVALNRPAVGVIVKPAGNYGNQTPPRTDYVRLVVEVWFSAERFRSDTTEGLSTTEGIYEMFDDITAALQGETPTSADQPLLYGSGGLAEVDEGLVTAYVEYETAVLLV